ncbi:hypothetical protein [Archangium sp.]|uniref:hypothetical protein n=1 Tax=Archangium sp. TaxID=1872627 RepID=UPI002D710A44|nr:hypothetical protein [Archangium sp.]HYO59347.1 hypothetical protein [Archangium sp.]
MELIIRWIGGVVLGYLIVSVAESFLHNTVQHGRTSMRRVWEKHQALFGPFLRAYFSHHIIHHCRTFRQDHVTQFRGPEEKARLDATLSGFHGELIKRERYGVSLSDVGILMFILPVIGFLPPIYYFLGGWVFAGVLLPYALYPAASKFLHPYLHMRYEDALRTVPGPLRWFLRTRYCRFIYRHHYLHHRYVRCNYNLLFGGDWLLGVHRPPASKDLEDIRTLGLPVD